MFAYILRAHQPPSEETDDLFRRFKETPGLLHAYSLQGEDDPNEAVVVTLWESREAADRYLEAASLRQEADQAIPSITRTMYSVRDSK